MRIERIIAKQVHPLPKQAYSPPRGGSGADPRTSHLSIDGGTKGSSLAPLDSEIYKRPEIITDYTPQPNGGDEEMPIGSTAQNNFQPIKWYRCKVCDVVASEYSISDHYGCQEASDV